MEGYLGEQIVQIETSPFNGYTAADWALYFIGAYGQIDGAEHKQWTLDQVARILNGTKIIVKIATWENGHSEYRIELDEPSDKYNNWAVEQLGAKDEDGEYEYDYNTGIAP